MIPRDEFGKIIGDAQKFITRGKCLFFGALIVAIPIEILMGAPRWLGFLLQTVMMAGGACIGYAMFSVIKKVRCPNCSKRLSYLVMDYSYSKKLLISGLPKNIPSDIEKCPYCNFPFTS
jgi:DNA-directed RNA polymerase subunit RPC12/RpoP